MKRWTITCLVVAVLLAGGYTLLRMEAPETVVEPADEPAEADGASEPAPVILWPERGDEPEAEPESGPQRPLSTELEPEPAPLETGDGRVALADRPYLHLDLTPRRIARPEIETLNLFNPRYNTRGVLQRHWMTERFGIQGGFGYSQDEETEDRDVAVGVGVVITY